MHLQKSVLSPETLSRQNVGSLARNPIDRDRDHETKPRSNFYAALLTIVSYLIVSPYPSTRSSICNTPIESYQRNIEILFHHPSTNMSVDAAPSDLTKVDSAISGLSSSPPDDKAQVKGHRRASSSAAGVYNIADLGKSTRGSFC